MRRGILQGASFHSQSLPLVESLDIAVNIYILQSAILPRERERERIFLPTVIDSDRRVAIWIDMIKLYTRLNDYGTALIILEWYLSNLNQRESYSGASDNLVCIFAGILDELLGKPVDTMLMSFEGAQRFFILREMLGFQSGECSKAEEKIREYCRIGIAINQCEEFKGGSSDVQKTLKKYHHALDRLEDFILSPDSFLLSLCVWQRSEESLAKQRAKQQTTTSSLVFAPGQKKTQGVSNASEQQIEHQKSA